MSKKVRVKAPATISNLNCGFDILGLAVNEPYDIIELEMNDSGRIEIADISGCQNLSRDPGKNVVGVVLAAMIQHLKTKTGFVASIHKGINPGSGIGSSAASSAGAAYAANILLGKRFSEPELVAFAMEGEKLASGSAHADNVAPALMGGITLVRSYEPLDIVKVTIPSDLYCVIIHPELEIRTSEARKILDKNIPLNTAVRQWGNVGGLIAGLYSENYDLISRSLVDYVAEPKRAALIPDFSEIRDEALKNGALGAGISGSGPSIFSLCRGPENAALVYTRLVSLMNAKGRAHKAYLSTVSQSGASEI